MPSDTDPAALKPGQFIWDLAATTGGPVVVAVSVEEQRAYVYRNGLRIGVSTVSTGRPGHATPTGVFTVLQKDKDHHSKNYNNAAMPYTERLTWDGVALHAGGLPGYPSSHGCVHLPTQFAERLFEISPMGMTVVIADQHSPDQDLRHPLAIEPVDARTGAELPKRGSGAAGRRDASPGRSRRAERGADRHRFREDRDPDAPTHAPPTEAVRHACLRVPRRRREGPPTRTGSGRPAGPRAERGKEATS
jgi:hypothetical protein